MSYFLDIPGILQRENIMARLRGQDWEAAFLRLREILQGTKQTTDRRMLYQYGMAYSVEDIVQGTFEKFLRKRLDIMKRLTDRVSDLIRFIYAMNRNACIDLLRKRNLLNRLEPANAGGIQSNPGDPVQQVLVKQALAALPELHRHVLIFRIIHEMTLVETAEIMNKSVGWVWITEKDAKRRLRRILEDDDNEIG